MPPVVATAAAELFTGAAVGSFSAALATESLAVFASYGAGYAVGTVALGAAMGAAGRALAPKLGPGAISSGSPLQMSRDPLAPRRIIYGQTRVAGALIYVQVTGSKSEYVHLIEALAAHELAEIGDVYFADEVVPLSGNAATGTFAGLARVTKYPGDNAQTADGDLIAESGGQWTTNHRLRGIPNLYARLKYDTTKFPGGLPNLSAVVKGRKVLDPRAGILARTCDLAVGNTNLGCADVSGLSAGMVVIGPGIVSGTKITSVGSDSFSIDTDPVATNTTASLAIGTAAWSANPALCILDYLLNPTFGLGVDYASEIDSASFIAAANICDEAVARADPPGGTEPRYTVNGAFELSAEPATILEKLADTMAGIIVYVGGKWFCHAGAHRTPAVTLDENDLRGAISVQTKLSLRDTCNRVKGTFISTDEKWQPVDFTAIVNATYLAEDGGAEIWRDLALPFTTSHATAQRLAKIELERTRQDISVKLPCKLTALRVQAGDVVMINNTRFGWSGKQFLVTGLKFAPYESDGTIALGVDLELRETASAVWDWNSGMETTRDPAPNTTLKDPRNVAAPTALVLTSAGEGLLQEDGTYVPRLKVAWTAPADQAVQSGGEIRIQYKRAADSSWSEAAAVKGDQVFTYLLDVVVATAYEVQLQAVNNFGAESAWVSPAAGAHTIAGDLTAPAALAAPGVTAYPGYNNIHWSASAAADASEYRIYRNTANSTSGANFHLLGETGGLDFDDPDVTPGATYWYFVSVVDASENESALSPGTSVVTAAAPLGAIVPDQPPAFGKPSPAVDGTYLAGDGTVLSFLTLRVPPLPANAVWQTLLYRRLGASEWRIQAHLKNTANTDVRLDDLSPGVSYDIGLQAWSGAGGSAIRTATSSPFTAPGDTTAPSALGAPTVTAYPGYNNILWSRSSAADASEYRVYRNTSNTTAGATRLGETGGLDFDDPDVTPGVPYWYFVSVVDTSENESALSGSGNATTALAPVGAAVPDTPGAFDKPSPAADGSYTAGDGTVFSYITLRVPALPAHAVWQNLLYRTENGTGNWLVAAQLKNTSATDVRLDDLSPTIRYEVALQAWSGAGGSAIQFASSSPYDAPGKTTPPLNPTGFSVQSPSSDYPVPARFWGGAQMFAATVLFTPSTSPDVAYYEYIDFPSDTSPPSPTEPGVVRVSGSANQFYYYSVLLVTQHLWVRATNRSGKVSAWSYTGLNMQSYIGLAAGTMSVQNNTDVDINGGHIDVDHEVTAPSFKSTSSRRFKRRIRKLQGALAKVRALRAVTFDWKKQHRPPDTRKRGRAPRDFGVIAEEVAKIFPTAVGRDEQGRIANVDYGKLAAVLIGAVHELEREVRALRRKHTKPRRRRPGKT